MRKLQLLALSAVPLAVVVAGAASASALPTAAPQHAAAVTLTRHFIGPIAATRPVSIRTRAQPAAGCGFTNVVPYDRYKGLPDFTPARAARPYIARMHTTQGLIVIKALTAQAPCTTFSFRFLAQRHYFDRTHCHRLTVQGIFVLQCGDPTGTGAGGPGYKFNDENLAGATYPAGTVAMANAGPDTNGSQFFFVWKNTSLPPLYTPFATVIKGMNVLLRIAAAGDDSQNGPGDGYPHLFVGFRHIQIVFTR
jgi:peptidyl-prolyl cis-trans isomerase B (cyclophilin B)